MIEARAAFIFWNRHSGQAEFRSLGKQIAWEMPGFIQFTRARSYFRFGKFTNCFLQQKLIFGELQIHGASLPVLLIVSRNQASAFFRRAYVVESSSGSTRVSPCTVMMLQSPIQHHRAF